MRDVMVMEQGHSGHVLVYVRQICRYGVQAGAATSFYTSQATLDSPEFDKHLSDLRPDVGIHVSPSPTVRDALSLCRAGNLVVPHADPHLVESLFVRVRRGQQLTLLVMRDPKWETRPSVRRRVKLLAKQFSIWLLRHQPRKKVFMLRHPGYEPIPGEDFVSDPVLIDGDRHALSQDAMSMRKRFNLASEVQWVGVLGGMQARKNPLLVAEAVKIARDSYGQELGLALLGPWPREGYDIRAQVRRYCEDNGVPLRLSNTLLSNSEFNAACLAVDIVAMAYSSHSPNSTLGKCAHLGQRLAAAGNSSIAHFVDALDLGPTAPLSATHFAAVIHQKLTAPPPIPRKLAGGKEFALALVGGLEYHEGP